MIWHIVGQSVFALALLLIVGSVARQMKGRIELACIALAFGILIFNLGFQLFNLYVQTERYAGRLP